MSDRQSIVDNVLRLLDSDEDPGPPPMPVEKLEKESVDPHEAFGQLTLEEAAGGGGGAGAVGGQAEVPKEVEKQHNKAIKQGLTQHQPDHKRVPTMLPAEIWEFPQYEGLDFTDNNTFTSLGPYSEYNISYQAVQSMDAPDNPDMKDIWVSMSINLPPGKHPRERLVTNCGLITVNYTRTSQKLLLGQGGFGKVFKAIGHFLTPDTPVDMTQFDQTRHLVNRHLVVKELFCKPGGRPHDLRLYGKDPNQASGPPHMWQYCEMYPLDFAVPILTRHAHVMRLFDYTVYNYAPGYQMGQIAMWVGFLEYLRGGDLHHYIKRWCQYKVITHFVPEGQYNHDQQVQLLDAFNRYKYPVYGAIPELVVRGFMQQLYEAIFYLHSFGVAHMDLKPQNVMFDQHGTLKVVDMGLALPIRSGNEDEEWSLTGAGTPGYVAPEICNIMVGQYHNQPMLKRPFLATKSDSFTLGVIIFECLYGVGPIPVFYETIIKPGRQQPEEVPDYGRLRDMIYMGQDDGAFFWARQFVNPNRATNPVSGAAITLIGNSMVFKPEYRISVEEALSGEMERVDWLCPKTKGIDTLHDFFMEHGTIQPA